MCKNGNSALLSELLMKPLLLFLVLVTLTLNLSSAHATLTCKDLLATLNERAITPSQWIRIERDRRGLTQQQLALGVGVTQKDISFWENEKQKVPEDVLTRLISFFDLDDAEKLPLETTSGVPANLLPFAKLHRMEFVTQDTTFTIHHGALSPLHWIASVDVSTTLESQDLSLELSRDGGNKLATVSLQTSRYLERTTHQFLLKRSSLGNFVLEIRAGGADAIPMKVTLPAK